LKKVNARITTTRELNFEKRTHERTTTREVHFEKTGKYGSLPRASVNLKSEPMNEQLPRARCTLKYVRSYTDHYHARVELWKAKPTSNESNQTQYNLTQNNATFPKTTQHNLTWNNQTYPNPRQPNINESNPT